MGRLPCCDKESVKKGSWSAEEDQKLINFVVSNGKICCWRMVPKLAGLLRCGKSCRLRWVNYLRPDVKRGVLSDAEEQLFIGLHARLGNRWSQIASRMPGRTDNELKNHWNTYIQKKLIKMGIDPVTHEPLEILYEEPIQDEEVINSQTADKILSSVHLQCENEVNCQMTEKILSPEPAYQEEDQTNSQTDKILSHEPLHDEEETNSQTADKILSYVPLQCENEVNCQMTENILSPEPLPHEEDQTNYQTVEMILSQPLQSPLDAEKHVTPVQKEDNDIARTPGSTCYGDQSNLLSTICAQIDESIACYMFENGTPTFLNSPREFPDTTTEESNDLVMAPPWDEKCLSLFDCQDFGIQDFGWDESCSSLLDCPDVEIQELGFDS